MFSIGSTTIRLSNALIGSIDTPGMWRYVFIAGVLMLALYAVSGTPAMVR
jgi:hypothetical protein